MRFAKKKRHDTSEARRMQRRMTMEVTQARLRPWAKTPPASRSAATRRAMSRRKRVGVSPFSSSSTRTSGSSSSSSWPKERIKGPDRITPCQFFQQAQNRCEYNAARAVHCLNLSQYNAACALHCSDTESLTLFWTMLSWKICRPTSTYTSWCSSRGRKGDAHFDMYSESLFDIHSDI